MSEYVRVRSGFLRDGRTVKGGEVIAGDDPILKGIPRDYLEPLDEVVETATRRPGEKRVLPGQPASTVVMRAQPASRRRARKATPPPAGGNTGDAPPAGADDTPPVGGNTDGTPPAGGDDTPPGGETP